MKLLDGLIERGMCLLGFVPIHEGMEERACRGWGGHGGSPRLLLEEAEGFRHLFGGSGGAKIRLGELIFPVVERAGKAVDLRGIHEAPLFPPLSGQEVIPCRRQRPVADRSTEQLSGLLLALGERQHTCARDCMTRARRRC